jgi:hypothetical protein
MASSDSTRKLLPDWVNAPDLTRWLILGDLAARDEDELRIILRPHEDQGLTSGNDRDIIPLRRQLDSALDELTLIEIAFQLNLLGEEHLCRLVTRPAESWGLYAFEKLCRSEAILRYVTAYQYFGIRMLASRLFPPLWWDENGVWEQRNEDVNRRSLPIAYPPPLHLPERGAEWFSRFYTLLGRQPHTIATDFLDGFYTSGEKGAYEKQVGFEAEEPQEFELWLRGLRPGLSPADEGHFRDLASDILGWAQHRCEFYRSLQQDISASGKPGDPADAEPVLARFALFDIYWLRRVLRADVSAAGRVVYARNTWFKLIRDRALLDRNAELSEGLGKLIDYIRTVFDAVCDLAQNAVDIADEQERRIFQPEHYSQGEVKPWREVFNEELVNIAEQREYRTYRAKSRANTGQEPQSGKPEPANDIAGEASAAPPKPKPGFLNRGWSDRLIKGKQPRRLVGLALSGGGIRSATFNLGVLQGLQEFDLLRQIDYLSTVSGGGFIGSWLVANAKRTRHWLGKATCWDESIAHLRSYSKYLAPITGIFSADTWSMVTAWGRNTVFVQVTAFTWLLAVFAALVAAYKGFSELTRHYGPLFKFDPKARWWSISVENLSWLAIVVAALGSLTTVCLAYNFKGDRVETGKHSSNGKWVRRLAVVPCWIAAILITLKLWNEAVGAYCMCLFDGYMHILLNLVLVNRLLFLGDAVALAILAWFTFAQRRGTSRRVAVLSAIGVALLSILSLDLALAAIVDLFATWAGPYHSAYQPAVFVFGPSLVLLAFSLSVLMLIGLTGRWTIEAQREWWTRFGAWIAMYGAVTMLLGSAALFGPWLIVHFPNPQKVNGLIPTTAITGWIGTVIAGLFAGKSSKTSGSDANDKSPSLERLANVGGVLFLIGMMLLAAMALEGFLTYYAGLPLFERDLSYEKVVSNGDINWVVLGGTLAVLAACCGLFSWCFEINVFGLNQFYRNRLVRCYLGATRWIPGLRKPHSFTKFDFKDDLPLRDLKGRDQAGNLFPGPFPILNCTLNLAGSSDLALNTRHSASFSLTPLYCGCDRPKVGYAPTEKFAGGVMLGQAVSISGAAASPNMGYNTSPLVAFLMTMFNVRLGWWFPNPSRRRWKKSGLPQSFFYLTRELMGAADENRLHVNVSDGGHFENLGVYELIRRRCEVIIACDSECDESLQFGGLGNLLRICETDFGAIIDLDVKSIREQKDGQSLSHCAVGRIKYDNGSTGYLIYLKASVTGDEEVGIRQYRASHPSFPHETTADQFFTEDQFESYRKLGLHIARKLFCGTLPGQNPVDVADRLIDMNVPAGSSSEAFVRHSQSLNKIMESFRAATSLHAFFNELTTFGANLPPYSCEAPSQEEFIVGVELIQLMEDVFLDLRLEEFWDHPDNRGWAILFMRWARSPKFQAIWDQGRRTFGIRFEYFCSTRLGLTRDRPIVRV